MLSEEDRRVKATILLQCIRDTASGWPHPDATDERRIIHASEREFTNHLLALMDDLVERVAEKVLNTPYEQEVKQFIDYVNRTEENE